MTNEELYQKYLNSPFDKKENVINEILISKETQAIKQSQLKKYRTYAEYDDLDQAASVGIFTGITTFDSTLGIPLNAYLTNQVYYSILNLLNSNKMFGSSQGVEQNKKLLKSILEKNNNDFEKSKVEFMKESGIKNESTVDKYLDYINLGMNTISLDKKVDENSDIDRLDTYSTDDLNPEERLTREALNNLISESFKELLTETERNYMSLFLGFNCQSMSEADIARKYNVSRQRVSQVINKAYNKLKKSNELKEELRALNSK